MPSPKAVAIATGLFAGMGGITYGLGALNSGTQISELIKKENKHVLLTSQSTKEEWKAALQEYQKSNNIWGEFAITGDDAPKTFKDKCEEKSKLKVYGTTDKAYEEVTKYCSRDKTIKDLLSEQGFASLGSGETAKWKERFNAYKVAKSEPKLLDVVVAEGETGEQNHNKLNNACAKALDTKVTDTEFENTINAIKHWCKAK